MALYKYCRKPYDVLSNCMIRFTPLADFNDPFDCLLDTSLLNDQSWIAEMREKVFAARVIDETRAAIQEGRPVRVIDPQTSNQVFSEIYRDGYEVFQKKFIQFQKEATERFRILSLSKVPPESAQAILHCSQCLKDSHGRYRSLDLALPLCVELHRETQVVNASVILRRSRSKEGTVAASLKEKCRVKIG